MVQTADLSKVPYELDVSLAEVYCIALAGQIGGLICKNLQKLTDLRLKCSGSLKILMVVWFLQVCYRYTYG